MLKAVQDLWDELNEAAAEADAELEELEELEELADAETGCGDEADEGGKEGGEEEALDDDQILKVETEEAAGAEAEADVSAELEGAMEGALLTPEGCPVDSVQAMAAMNSSSHPKDWRRFTLSAKKDSKQWSSDVTTLWESDKQDLFRVFMSCGGSWDQVRAAVTRRVANSSKSTKGWVAKRPMSSKASMQLSRKPRW